MTSLFEDLNSTTDEAEITATIEALKARYAKEDGSFDAEAILKKAAHADRHIKTLEKEAAERAQNAKVSQTLEEIIAKIEAKSNARSEQQSESETPNLPSEGLDFDKILEQRFQKYEAQKTAERNRQHVTDELKRMWGDDYVSKLRAKAHELGEDETFLDQLAANRPQTFLALVKETKTPSVHDTITPPPGSRIQSSTKSGLKTYSDFEKIRKEDPNRYKSKSIQDELFRLTAEYAAQGKSFTST